MIFAQNIKYFPDFFFWGGGGLVFAPLPSVSYAYDICRYVDTIRSTFKKKLEVLREHRPTPNAGMQ